MYIISGSNTLPKCKPSGFETNTNCVYKFDLKSSELKKCADLEKGRQAFGICCIGKYIYIAGGMTGGDN